MSVDPVVRQCEALASGAGQLQLTRGLLARRPLAGKYHQESESKCYEKDVGKLFEFGFDGIKLDNCGQQKDLQLWADLINATGKPVTIENCHWGFTVPHQAIAGQVPDHANGVWCPWNFYRTSQDVRARFANVVKNLESTVPFARKGLSFPGCWVSRREREAYARPRPVRKAARATPHELFSRPRGAFGLRRSSRALGLPPLPGGASFLPRRGRRTQTCWRWVASMVQAGTKTPASRRRRQGRTSARGLSSRPHSP